MLKALFSAITGINEDEHDSDENQSAWELQRYQDENDCDDFDFDSQEDETGDEPENVKSWLGWFGL